MPDSATNHSMPHSDSQALGEQLDMLAALGKSLHQVGLSAHRVEDALGRAAAQYGTQLQVFSLPTGLMLSVDARPTPVTLLLRVPPGAVHLEQLSKLSAISGQITRGLLGAEEAQGQIEQVMQAPPRWGRLATVLAYVLSAGAFAVFFGGDVPEVITGTIVGLAVGILSVIAHQMHLSRMIFELVAATVAAATANLATAFYGPFAEWIPLAAGLIILLPGLALVDAIEELAHGHLTSGSARLAGVGAVLLAMTFGALLGLVLIDTTAIDQPPSHAPALGTWYMAAALVAVAIGSTIRFRGRAVDMWVALAASAMALVGAKVGAAWLGQFAGPFLAAFLLGATANGYARISGRPAQLFTVPGLALLVPGSFGVRSMSALLSENTAVGVDTAFHMFLAAMALVTGLLIANSMFRHPDADI